MKTGPTRPRAPRSHAELDPSVTPSPGTAPLPWSTATRILGSIALLAYLGVAAMGPVTNPIATEELTAPIGRSLSPVHQILFLGHGYRFFAPDPGPSHRVLYRIYDAEGELHFNGHFPDPQVHWPRVIYHRWFMLSETLFEELNRTPDSQGLAGIQATLNDQITTLEQAGRRDLAAPLIRIRDRQQRMYPQTLKRIEALKQSIGQALLARHGGHRVELFVQERGLPTPARVALGESLGSTRLLSEPIQIGVITRAAAEQEPQ